MDLIVNFAPTGMVPTKAMTPHVPLSPQEIVDIAARKIGKRAHVAVFPEGGATFPIVRE